MCTTACIKQPIFLDFITLKLQLFAYIRHKYTAISSNFHFEDFESCSVLSSFVNTYMNEWKMSNLPKYKSRTDGPKAVSSFISLKSSTTFCYHRLKWIPSCPDWQNLTTVPYLARDSWDLAGFPDSVTSSVVMYGYGYRRSASCKKISFDQFQCRPHILYKYISMQ